MDFGELEDDLDFVTKVNRTTEAFDNIEECIKKVCSFPDYDSLTIEEKVKCDLFAVYSINSLFWTYLKLQGKDLSNHMIKNELSRVRQAMVREKNLHERNTIRPKLDVPVAKRFIRHELWTPKDKKMNHKGEDKTKNRKRKFNDDDG